jgi:AcrR family transcriptional regulator
MTNVSALHARQHRKPSRIAEERRRNLIEAAIRSIATHGYDAVTVAMICNEAGFSRGLIGHYFAGKDELLLAAVRTVAAELGAAIRSGVEAAGTDPAARLHGLIDASFTTPGFTPEKVAVWVALTGTARWSRPLATIYRVIWRDYRRGVGRLFERAARLRGIKLDAELTALSFSHLVQGLWIGWAADESSVSPKRAAACCHAFVDQVLSKATGTGSARSRTSVALRRRAAI